MENIVEAVEKLLKSSKNIYLDEHCIIDDVDYQNNDHFSFVYHIPESVNCNDMEVRKELSKMINTFNEYEIYTDIIFVDDELPSDEYLNNIFFFVYFPICYSISMQEKIETINQLSIIVDILDCFENNKDKAIMQYIKRCGSLY